MRQDWTENDGVELLALLKSGATNGEIAQRMGKSYHTIKHRVSVLRKSGVFARPIFEWTPTLQALAFKAHKEGRHAREIASEIGCCVDAVWRLLSASRRKPTVTPEAPAFKPVIAGARTIVNAAMRGTLTGGDWIPARIGAMDYAAIKSRGF